MWQTIAEGTIASLEYITIIKEKNWFEGRQECLDLFLAVLSRQSALQKLEMGGNGLDANQQQQIRDVVRATSPRCDIVNLK